MHATMDVQQDAAYPACVFRLLKHLTVPHHPTMCLAPRMTSGAMKPGDPITPYSGLSGW